MLGGTGLRVSRLCFGSLTIGPLQAKLPLKEGTKVIEQAFDLGVNFIDTAELYKNYDYISAALKGRRDKVIVSTKSYAYSAKGAEESLKKALSELGTDYIDIFLLHEQESEHTIRGHYEALEYFLRAKEKGLIRAVGLSTHAVAAVKASLKYKDIEVLHPIVNKAGLGILDGSMDEMLGAIDEAHRAGKGIFSMKPLGGGNLIKNSRACFDFVLAKDSLDSIAVGMQSTEEVINNVKVFESQAVPESITRALQSKSRRLAIEDWCEGCGKCINRCGQKALRLESGKVIVKREHCVLCGYCSAVCEGFCIKIY